VAGVERATWSPDEKTIVFVSVVYLDCDDDYWLDVSQGSIYPLGYDG
jgi:hypothetical protein